MMLRDGRTLGYDVYGDRQGVPLILLHGTPGSRVWFLEDDETAKKLGVYLIATDRPGYGLSSALKNRTLLHYANDIEQLANHLQFDTFALLGVSGGGAFAAAIVHRLRERVTVCNLVSTATPFINGKPSKYMAKENRIAFFLSKHLPFIIKLSNKAQKKMIDTNPEKFKDIMKKSGSHLAKWDNDLLQRDDILNTTVVHNAQAYRQGVDEVIYESNLLAKEWGFAVEDIDVPVNIWHGEEDTLSPIEEVKLLAQKIPHCQTYYIPKAGHFLTENDELWERMLATVVERR